MHFGKQGPGKHIAPSQAALRPSSACCLQDSGSPHASLPPLQSEASITHETLLARLPSLEDDWQLSIVDPGSIDFCQGADGSLVELGRGAFSKVGGEGGSVGDEEGEGHWKSGIECLAQHELALAHVCSPHTQLYLVFDTACCTARPPPASALLLQVYRAMLDGCQPHAVKVIELGEEPHLQEDFLQVLIAVVPGTAGTAQLALGHTPPRLA